LLTLRTYEKIGLIYKYNRRTHTETGANKHILAVKPSTSEHEAEKAAIELG